MAGPFDKKDNEIRHFVPADKKLHKQWVKSLFAKGVQEVYRGDDLETIGMPIGGIGAGQLYLCGDGTLGCWQIFNQHHFSGGGGKELYKPRTPDKPVEQGFAVIVDRGGEKSAKKLNKKDFSNVEFTGQYPIGTVRYEEDGFPVKVEMKAFSPFIPLNAQDSALPATVFHIKMKNTSNHDIRVALAGWLENAVCCHSNKMVKAHRCSQIVHQQGRAMILHTARQLPEDLPAPPRETIVLGDFEGTDFGNWQVEGTAFGAAPRTESLPDQRKTTGFFGKSYADSFHGGGNSKGKLISPTFTISRKYLNFRAGGRKLDTIRIELIVDGKTVQSAIPRNQAEMSWFTWDLSKLQNKQAHIEVIDDAASRLGYLTVDQFELSDQYQQGPAGPFELLDDYGSMALTLAGPMQPLDDARDDITLIPDIGNKFSTNAEQLYPNTKRNTSAMISQYVPLKPGAEHTFTCVLTWFFPNMKYAVPDQEYPSYRADHVYANWFNGADNVAHYVLDHHDRLTGDTRKWHDTYYDSTLPWWLLNRLHAPLSYLATGTCQWWKNGRFWAWEGVGCCAGTCTHVWSYVQGMARLFPELERSVRERQDLCESFQADGLVWYRGKTTQQLSSDGQCGTVLKCYREHLISPDNNFLKRNWPKIRKVLEFCIREDENEDGLIEKMQDNVYDFQLYGANTFVGSLYLAALRAGEEMAKTMQDRQFAERVRRIFNSGKKLSVEKLFNGEYFTQDVDVKKHPRFQYGQGCLSDQLFGQSWARQLALGNIYPDKNVKKALRSVWKYNWAPDIAPQNQVHTPARWFINKGQAGLFNCTWPKSKHLDHGIQYRNEVWTGIEYQVAGHMIWEGMLTEGLAIIRAVHDRYHPSLFNPYNEIECGDHYARALASWGCFTALSGFEYNGPRGHLAFAPKITPHHFRSAFTAAEGWGSFDQKRQDASQQNRIEICWGQLRLKQIVLNIPHNLAGASVTASLSGKSIKINHSYKNGRLSIIFPHSRGIHLYEGDALMVYIG